MRPSRHALNSITNMTRHRSQTQAKPHLTHFLCLPLVNHITRPQLESKLEAFSNDVRSLVPEKAIRPVGVLHLTIGVMSLDAQKLKLAVETLQALDLAAILRESSPDEDSAVLSSSNASRPLEIRLQGIESMHDVGKTSILYIPPKDDSGRLQLFCLALQKHFRDKELLVPDDRPLKLHATIVNTVYAKGQSYQDRSSARMRTAASSTSAQTQGNIATDRASTDDGDGSSGHGPKAKGVMRFDAQAILEKYAPYEWTEPFVLDRVAICEMGAKKHYDEHFKLIDESYKEISHIFLAREHAEQEKAVEQL